VNLGFLQLITYLLLPALFYVGLGAGATGRVDRQRELQQGGTPESELVRGAKFDVGQLQKRNIEKLRQRKNSKVIFRSALHQDTKKLDSSFSGPMPTRLFLFEKVSRSMTKFSPTPKSCKQRAK